MASSAGFVRVLSSIDLATARECAIMAVTLRYMGGSKHIARRHKTNNREQTERKESKKRELENAAKRSARIFNQGTTTQEWQFAHARNDHRSLSSRLGSSERSEAHPKCPSLKALAGPPDMQSSKLARKMKLLQTLPGSLVALEAGSSVSANSKNSSLCIRHAHTEEIEALTDTQREPLITFYRPPSRSITDMRTPPHRPDSEPSSEPDVSFNEPFDDSLHELFEALVNLDSPPLILTFKHPCMISNETFPATLQRVEHGTHLEQHSRDWPYCLKQMQED